MPLHPESEAFLKEVAQSKRPAWNEMPLDAAREIFAGQSEFWGIADEPVDVHDLTGPNHPPLRIYDPGANKPLPAIVYFHGGGFVLGNLKTHDVLCRTLATVCKAAVISVDYRLAPEHLCPAAANDALLATRVVLESTKSLGLNQNRIYVAGDSAGGNLAMNVSLALRSRVQSGSPANQRSLAGQILIYPVVDTDLHTTTYMQYAEGYGLSRAVMQWFWTNYLGANPATPQANANAARLLQQPSLADLPRTMILLAEYDVLRSEGETLAAALRDEGVEVTEKHYAGMLHGFVHFLGRFSTGKTALRDIAAFLNEATA